MLLDQPEVEIVNLNGKSLSKMNNLRLLKISNVHISGDLEYLSNELRFLKWHKYPSYSLPSSFHAQKLCKLNMCYSHVEHLWNGIKVYILMLNLSECISIIKL
ncbi:hypothetical protein Pint_06933 [Pistacia integerrima]|uniref:Uncharacterized protein n=1 Tax=Pistacia integerrima TaxID=434235 RepID=A0ACC0XV00_9ROSI|nr:hypothetical protein Pint_06933 [Pistacia integerrima]